MADSGVQRPRTRIPPDGCAEQTAIMAIATARVPVAPILEGLFTQA